MLAFVWVGLNTGNPNKGAMQRIADYSNEIRPLYAQVLCFGFGFGFGIGVMSSMRRAFLLWVWCVIFADQNLAVTRYPCGNERDSWR